MNFEKLIKVLSDEQIPLDSIIFKANWMSHWYIPKKFSAVNSRKLMCISPTRRGPCAWDWLRGDTIHDQEIHKIVRVNQEVGFRRTSLITKQPILRVFLKGYRP